MTDATSMRSAATRAYAVAQEGDVLPRRLTLAITAGVLVVVIVAILLAGMVMRRFVGRLGGFSQAVTRTPVREIAAVEQTLIAHDRAGLARNEEQRRILRTYGWVDEARGVARIPVDRAMRIVAERARQGSSQ